MGTNRIEEFISAVVLLEDELDIQKACQSELEYLRSELTLTTVKRAVTRYRNAIKELSSIHPALSYFKLTKEEQAILKAANRSQVYLDHTNLRPIDADDLILKGVELLNSSSYLNVALGLMLLSGRRATEVLKTGQMTVQTDESVVFTGQLKTKGSDNAQTAPYEIPVLTKSQIVVNSVLRLRQLKDFSSLTNDQVHSRCNKSLNEYVKKHFDKLIPQVKVKDLRSAYATICYEFYCPDHISQTAYFAQVLGHSKEDLSTAQSYQDFYIP
jgi:hypothetical protein